MVKKQIKNGKISKKAGKMEKAGRVLGICVEKAFV
jgi:hypothetical protein